MPFLETRNFGTVPYELDSVLEFPEGLPGFEQKRRFLPIQAPDTEPLIFLQSAEDPSLCFVTLPILAVEPAYRLDMEDADKELIGLAPGHPPQIGRDVLCLTIVSIRESGPTANLLAPVVVNLRNRLAVQSVAAGSTYSHQFHLTAPQEAVAC
jgi:flagellar assembly factor FliW